MEIYLDTTSISLIARESINVFKFRVVDVLLEFHPVLRKKTLEIVSLSGEGIETAMRVRAKFPYLTVADSCVIGHLIQSQNDGFLITQCLQIMEACVFFDVRARKMSRIFEEYKAPGKVKSSSRPSHFAI